MPRISQSEPHKVKDRNRTSSFSLWRFQHALVLNIDMDETLRNIAFDSSLLTNALNDLERSRVDQQLLGSYKCPCTHCKGGGHPILRRTIELHLRRHGHDPTLTHYMIVSIFILNYSHVPRYYFITNHALLKLH